ncbi:MAG: hypothetical protein JW983_07305 [Elusimicrobia bacterium]|nr:hypothetical protein [Elusimicrobiota bacterium]
MIWRIMMDEQKIMRQYYDSELEKIKVVAPPPGILETEPQGPNRPVRFSLENMFGCLVTAGCLLSALAPESWFSFGRFLFSFRLGFLF